MRAAAVRRSVSLRTLSVKTDFRNLSEICWNWICNYHLEIYMGVSVEFRMVEKIIAQICAYT